ncbi:hypothetical protein ACFW04_011876 [Cataglyphis niger]
MINHWREGSKKFGDICEADNECGFAGSYCAPKKKVCACKEEFEATNHLDKCGHAANVNESCFFHEQCEVRVSETECRDGRCICLFEKIPVVQPDGIICVAEVKEPPSIRYIDPAMIGVLVGMALMFIIICVVLRLFSNPLKKVQIKRKSRGGLEGAQAGNAYRGSGYIYDRCVYKGERQCPAAIIYKHYKRIAYIARFGRWEFFLERAVDVIPL